MRVKQHALQLRLEQHAALDRGTLKFGVIDQIPLHAAEIAPAALLHRHPQVETAELGGEGVPEPVLRDLLEDIDVFGQLLSRPCRPGGVAGGFQRRDRLAPTLLQLGESPPFRTIEASFVARACEIRVRFVRITARRQKQRRGARRAHAAGIDLQLTPGEVDYQQRAGRTRAMLR